MGNSSRVKRHETADAKPIIRKTPIILGIEASCDETAIAILRANHNGPPDILASLISSQDEAHRPYGGVVPEIAARAHMQKISGLIEKAVRQADLSYTDITAVAATAGPGLIGGVIAGLMAAKGLCLSLNIPLIAINHLEGHALSPRLTQNCPYPYLLLLVSGGHTQILSVTALGKYERLGSTIDDALGEAFDKTAKIMDLGFPGGPKVEAIAKKGDPDTFKLPKPLFGKAHADFSFSGLKTAVLRAWEASNKRETDKANLAASFQKTVCAVLDDRLENAMKAYIAKQAGHISSAPAGTDKPHRFVVAGGVAANKAIRAALNSLCETNGFELIAPPHEFCTDNGAMIAMAGLEHYAQGNFADLSCRPRPRWPLDHLSAKQNPASGSGKKGPKS